jgi:ketosteroid isomerase-like protein
MFLGTACFCAIPASAQLPPDSTPTPLEIRQTLTAFLTAFDNLDWPAFSRYFAAGATVFHPAPPNEKRIDSPQEFEKAWLGVFARIKKASGRSAPPYINLQPQDLRIQLLSPDVSLVTFHLVDGPTLSRRTIVLRHESDGWKIVHIHASNLKMSPETESPGTR